jgi:hypothetical protein|tara:strand:+ start:93 stop:524 length:432 start_codon:yes stop_codon:yes gene_type:complete
METAKWFLAHSKQDGLEEVEQWCAKIGRALVQDGWKTKVVAGRDDYETRAAALGGWKAWCRDVPHGKDFSGAPMFHGVIVPMYSDDVVRTVGKATAQIVQGFLSAGKHVYCWCPAQDTFSQIESVEVLPDDDYIAWARLDFKC